MLEDQVFHPTLQFLITFRGLRNLKPFKIPTFVGSAQGLARVGVRVAFAMHYGYTS
jgi:hypothetical protein